MGHPEIASRQPCLQGENRTRSEWGSLIEKQQHRMCERSMFRSTGATFSFCKNSYSAVYLHSSHILQTSSVLCPMTF